MIKRKQNTWKSENATAALAAAGASLWGNHSPAPGPMSTTPFSPNSNIQQAQNVPKQQGDATMGNQRNEVEIVTFSKAKELLTVSWNTRLPMLLVGPPATAKTAIAHQWAEEQGFDIIVTTGATSLPTDVKGMPASWTGEDGNRVADFIPFGDLRTACSTETPTLWVLEDFTNSDPDTQKGFMQLLHERQVNEHKLSDFVHIIATGNRREDKSGVSMLLEAVKTRFGIVVEIEPDVDGWIDWATANGVHRDVRAFIQNNPDMLYVNNPTNDMTRDPNLRMWHFLSDTLLELEDMIADPDLIETAIKGVCGRSIGMDFVTFRSNIGYLPDLDDMFNNPDTADMPAMNDPGVLTSLTKAIVSRATMGNFSTVMTLAKRMPKEHAANVITAVVRKLPDVAVTQEYMDWSIDNQDNISVEDAMGAMAAQNGSKMKF